MQVMATAIMAIASLTQPIKLQPMPLEVILITSSTPATSAPRRRTVGVATGSIGRLRRTITAIRTSCTCIVPACIQVPLISTISTTASVLGV